MYAELFTRRTALAMLDDTLKKTYMRKIYTRKVKL